LACESSHSRHAIKKTNGDQTVNNPEPNPENSYEIRTMNPPDGFSSAAPEKVRDIRQNRGNSVAKVYRVV
jgi:hypothetical protein